MKNIVCLLLTLCTLLGLCACSKKQASYETPAFSKDLEIGASCYLDVVEVTPQRDQGTADTYLYCQCVSQDGETTVMTISLWDYKDYFDKDLPEGGIGYYANTITYDQPVRLSGWTKKELGKTVFWFSSADMEETNAGEKDRTFAKLDDSASLYSLVSTELSEIVPVYTVSPISGSFANYVICKGTTVSGETVWLYMMAGLYRNIDSYTVFESIATSGRGGDPVEFMVPVKFFGTLVDAEELDMLSVPDDVPKQLMHCYELDTETLKKATLENQPAVAYTGNEQLRQQVYADVTHIMPMWEVSSKFSSLIAGNLVCLCKTADGTEFWLEISVNDYKEYISQDYSSENNALVELPAGTRIYGGMMRTEDVSGDLLAEIAQELIFSFKELTVQE